MPDADISVVIAATFFLGGLVKGVIGFGLPTIALALLAVTLGLAEAMVLLVVPAFVTNVWQAVAGPALAGILRRLGPLLVAVCLGTWIGVEVLDGADTRWLLALLGALTALYGLYGLGRPRLPAPGRAEPWLSPLVGLANGLVTGLTGTFVVPATPYLQTLAMARDTLVQAMGVLYGVSTVALGVALGSYGFVSAELGGLSAAAVAPALLGMAAGQRLRRRLPEGTFARLFFAALLILGIAIVVRAAGAL